MTNWYVIQTKSRAEEEAAASLREAGFRVYLPKMAKDIIHHRTKKKTTRHFVLFNRYLFASPRHNPHLGAMKFCDGVDMVLKSIGEDGRYIPIAHRLVSQLMLDQRALKFDDTRRARIRRKQEAETEKETLRMLYPGGQRIRVKDDWKHKHPFGGFYGSVVRVDGKKRIRAMLELFGSLVPVEFNPDDIEAVDRAA